MDALLDPVMLSRMQFALTAMFHILWPVLTIGLSLFLVVLEILWLRTRDIDYYHHCRFWSRLLLLNFGVGVVSGIPMEFQFGTNWAPFAIASGDFFGNVLGFEAAMAFMLEAGFIGIMLFGWQRVAPAIHLFATIMVAFGASLSAFWIMSASSWMQTPTGVQLADGRIVVDSYFDAIFNPAFPTSFLHMWFAALETTIFVVGGISAWYLLKGRDVTFFLKSFRIMFIAAVVITPLQIVVGDISGLVAAKHQPAKIAAMEAHWETNPQGQGAPWSILAWPDEAAERNRWSLAIPNVLSLIIAHTPTGQVKGLRDFPPQDRPPVWIPFYSFRVMLAVGIWLFLLTAWTAWRIGRGALAPERIGTYHWLLLAWVCTIPLGYLAVEAGWLTREIGRQPWILYGLIRTKEHASDLPAAHVATTLVAYAFVYLLLYCVFIVFSRRLILKGPDRTMEPPHKTTGPVRLEPGSELGDQWSQEVR